VTAGAAYVVTPTSVADTAFLVFQPAGSSEIVLHNIYVPQGSAVELYWSNGTNDILIDSGTESYNDFHFHCTNTVYIRVKNVSGGSIRLGGDGMYTA
jgi:hypothetical protein